MTRLKIGFFTSGDARNRALWSGLPYYMSTALQEHCGDVVYLGLTPFTEAVGKAVNRRLRRRGWPDYFKWQTRAIAREYAWRLNPRLDEVDLLFVPAASTPIPYLRPDVPVIYAADATVQLLYNYYPRFQKVRKRWLPEANRVERLALHRADRIIYASDWAASSAHHFYGVPDEKIKVVPFGANLDSVPPDDMLAKKRTGPECDILFLGVEWWRKGGRVAFETVAELRERGLDARLTVCGCVPPEEYRADWLTIIPRLNKNKPDELAQLEDLIASSNFLLLPTEQECFGIVFCEASAYGTPSIAVSTGGVPNAVIEGQNGFLLPPGAPPEDFATRIQDLMGDAERYTALVKSSRKLYNERLNWDAWGVSVNEVITDLLRR